MNATLTRPRSRRSPSPSSAAESLAKVPRITALFWVIKILTTGMGESASDWLASNSLLVPALVGAGGLAIAMVRQFRAPRYHAPTYWFAVAMVAVFGTVVSDVFNPQAGGPLSVSLPVTAAGYAVALAACFATWWGSERTLSIHTITTRRREAFYWLTVLLTFALGTTVGDLTAFYLDLGFGTSALLFAGAIVVPGLLYRFVGLNAVVAFWASYVLTRPLGASIADWLGKDKPLGVGIGDGRIAGLAAVIAAALVVYMWRSRKDVPVT